MVSSSAALRTIDSTFLTTYQIFEDNRTGILVAAGSLMAGWIYNKLWVNRKLYASVQSMQGKTVLITGGNAGIGYETAKDLLRRDARVILVCRDMNKGRQAVGQLRAQTECKEQNIRLMQCDLSSLDSVRQFAQLYSTEEDRLDVLICNAGLVWSPDVVTKDGFNTIIQANYLGHFLLTNLLLDKLKSCRPSRIINVSSGAHRSVRSIDWSDAFTQFKRSRLLGAYPFSKAFQILSTHKLKRDLLATHGVNSFALHPGWVWTSIQSPMLDALGFCGFVLLYPLLRLFKIAFAKTPQSGARTTIFCAVDPSLERSLDLYFQDCGATRATSVCTDDQLAEQLWTASLRAVQLN